MQCEEARIEFRWYSHEYVDEQMDTNKEYINNLLSTRNILIIKELSIRNILVNKLKLSSVTSKQHATAVHFFPYGKNQKLSDEIEIKVSETNGKCQRIKNNEI